MDRSVRSFPALNKKMVNFGLLTTTVSWLMFTYPKSTLRMQRMLIVFELGPRDFATMEISEA